MPKEIIPNETKTFVENPQTHFHADVIKRAAQNILTIKDHFSSFQDAILINSESAKDLKEGLIIMTSAMRRPKGIFISVDNSPGFKTLLANKDEDLQKLKITMVHTDEINKNSNSIIDKGCQELEREIKQLEPEGAKISTPTLKQAILNLNSKLRRRGNISAYEINSARDQNTGDNLQLDDKELRHDQVINRKEKQEINNNENINIGDTVRIKNKSDKHKANEIFIVTSKQEDDVGVQKLLHLFRSNHKLMSKVYNTKQKHLVTIHKQHFPESKQEDPVGLDGIKQGMQPNKNPVILKPWNPINQNFFHDDSEDDTSDEDDDTKTGKVDDQQRRGMEGKTWNISDDENDEPEWDNSPEQYQLQEDEEIFELIPR